MQRNLWQKTFTFWKKSSITTGGLLCNLRANAAYFPRLWEHVKSIMSIKQKYKKAQADAYAGIAYFAESLISSITQRKKVKIRDTTFSTIIYCFSLFPKQRNVAAERNVSDSTIYIMAKPCQTTPAIRILISPPLRIEACCAQHRFLSRSLQRHKSTRAWVKLEYVNKFNVIKHQQWQLRRQLL